MVTVAQRPKATAPVYCQKIFSLSHYRRHSTRENLSRSPCYQEIIIKATFLLSSESVSHVFLINVSVLVHDKGLQMFYCYVTCLQYTQLMFTTASAAKNSEENKTFGRELISLNSGMWACIHTENTSELVRSGLFAFLGACRT